MACGVAVGLKYDFLEGPYIAQEPKICELCGKNCTRVIGSGKTICFRCHKNWNDVALEKPRIYLQELENETFEPEAVASRGRCRIRKA